MSALILLANGFEEIEAITIIDVLRRAEINVIIAGLDQKVITGAHGIKVDTDLKIEDFHEETDVIILPGGQPGSDHLAESDLVKSLIQKYHKNNKIVAAICAAPAVVLSPTGILDGKAATCYPGFEEKFSPNVNIQINELVVQDQNIITSKGPGTAFAFAYTLVEALKDKKTADQLRKAMLATTI